MKKEIKNGVILLSIGIIASISILMIKGNNLANVCITDYLNSKNVEYTNNNQSTVQGAIDDLYKNSNELKNIQNVLDNFIDTSTLKKNTAGTVFASSKGVCIKRKGTIHCFAPNNYNYEKTHIQNVFPDASCNTSTSNPFCSASDFYCSVSSTGSVGCYDTSDKSVCNVSGSGLVSCN